MSLDPRLPQDRRRFGQLAEQLAVDFLQRRGLKILFRNYRCPMGELDIVARDGNTVVFVEVRATASGELMWPALSIDQRKQRQIERLAQYFLAKHRLFRQPARFDVVLVADNWVPRNLAQELGPKIVLEQLPGPSGQRIGLLYFSDAWRSSP